MSPSLDRRVPRWSFILAVLTALCIFPLVFVGAGVTTKGAGMAFPDWPTSDGAVLIPKGWLSDSNKLWEHSHRLIGWTVGILAIGSVIASWRSNSITRRLTLLTLGLIIVQGVLGGVRVKQDSRTLAMVHGVSGQITFSMAAVTALVCSPVLASARRVVVPRAAFYQNGSVVCLAAAIVQVLLGAGYRHFQCPGSLVTHVLWALVVFMLLSWLTMWTLEQYAALQPLAFLGKSMAVLIAVQMVLGGAAFLTKVMGAGQGSWVATFAPSAHVAVGALMLACTALMVVSGFCILSPAAQANRRSARVVTT